MLNKYYTLILGACLSVLIYSCTTNSTKKISRKKIDFSICDSIHYFEQPRWWDDINILIDDSIMNVSKTADQYLRLCSSYRTDKLYKDTIYKASYLQRDKYNLKAKYLYHKIKKSTNTKFLYFFSDKVSHDLAIKINEQLFNCDPNFYNSEIAHRIGDDYAAICNYKEATRYYNLGLALNKKARALDKDSTKLSDYNNRERWLNESLTKLAAKSKDNNQKALCGFRNDIAPILENINKYTTPKRKEEIKAFLENRAVKEILDDALNKNTDYFYKYKTTYELALCNLLYEDSKSEKPLIITPKILKEVKENFKGFNELDHANFEIGVSDVGTLNEDKDEWNLSFWSDIENSHGITVVYFKGYEVTGVYSVD